MSKNQCDGCLRGLSLEGNLHMDGKNPVQVCQKGLYEDDKSDNIGVKIVTLMRDTLIQIEKYGLEHPGNGYSCAVIAKSALDELQIKRR